VEIEIANPPDLDYGLGLRPDLTGQGLGLEFFRAGLAFARERYEPQCVYLHVAEFNERARPVYILRTDCV
jgi:[ribosomal protein S18]-alanine N-acetyltransferase